MREIYRACAVSALSFSCKSSQRSAMLLLHAGRRAVSQQRFPRICLCLLSFFLLLDQKMMEGHKISTMTIECLMFTSNDFICRVMRQCLCKHCIPRAAREPVFTPNSGSQSVCSDTVRDFWSWPFSSLHSHHGPPGGPMFPSIHHRQVQRRESQTEKRWLIIRATRTQRTSVGCLQAKATIIRA